MSCTLWCQRCGCHRPHPEDAVPFPLALVRVDGYSVETHHFGDRLAQQVCPKFTVHKHHHRRLVQLAVLKGDKETCR